MTQEACDALTLWLEEHNEVLVTKKRVYIPRARYHPLLRKFDKADLTLVQTLRSHYRALEQGGYQVHTELPTATPLFDLAIVVPTNQKIESRGSIAYALSLLAPEGIVVVAAENARGGKSYRKELTTLCGETTDSWSKRHCTISWAKRPDTLSPYVLESLKSYHYQSVTDDGITFISRPGIYGWDSIDRGSKLLIEHGSIPRTGNGADIGCGYGYLSMQLLREEHAIASLHLIDVEHLSIEAARRTIEPLKGRCTTEYFWLDAECEKLPAMYDWVMINPPCHREERLDYSIGEACITKALHHLKPGGQISLVALETIPYEKTLRAHQISFRETIRSSGFKVLVGMRP
jgi:16S rRNA (guanine1207-N2)-methyltransferase